jgi:transposase
MARAYSDDLRRTLLEAHEQGEGSLAELAKRFRVSEGWAYKIWARSRTGKTERPVGGKRGRKSRITIAVMEYLRSRVKEQPDRTLGELQEDLRNDQDVEIGITWLWMVLREMGLRLKKSHSTRPTGQRTSPGTTPVLATGKPVYRPGAICLRGRKRHHHGNDPTLWPRFAWRTRR